MESPVESPKRLTSLEFWMIQLLSLFIFSHISGLLGVPNCSSIISITAQVLNKCGVRTIQLPTVDTVDFRLLRIKAAVPLVLSSKNTS